MRFPYSNNRVIFYANTFVINYFEAKFYNVHENSKADLLLHCLITVKPEITF